MTSARSSRLWGLVALAAVLGVFATLALFDRAPAVAGVEERLLEFDQRLARLERVRTDAAQGREGPRLAPAPIREFADAAVPSRATPERADTAAHEAFVPPDEMEPQALFDLLDLYLSQKASPEDQERLFQTLRDGRTVPAVLSRLESAVESQPDDLDARMQLASAYLAKLFTVPAGPEMAVWGRKAEAQWTAVLERDERHWEARFRRGTSYAYYPDVANKTPDAIREFELLREQQEGGPPETRQAGVYVMLTTLYRRQGDSERAQAALEAGRRRHPDAPALQDRNEGR